MARTPGTRHPRGTVAGVLLAAGASSRFGDRPPKQLARLGNEPLVRRIARRALASDLAELIVVVGFEAAAVGRAVADLPLRIVENRDWSAGQSTSVRAGVLGVADGFAAALFLTADQPHLDAAVLNRLLAAYAAGDGPIIVPTCGGRRVAPVLFDRALFPELLGLSGDAGGRQLFSRHADEIVEVPFPDPEPFEDIDTPEDLDGLVEG